MYGLNKNIYKKIVIVLVLITGLLSISESNVHARFMKKIVLEPLENPSNWEKSFKPGVAFTLMLEKSLADSDQFQIVQTFKKPTKKLAPSIFKNRRVLEEEKAKAVEKANSDFTKEEHQNIVKEENPEVAKEKKIDRVNSSKQIFSSKTPSGQYQVRGRILFFDPDTNPQKDGHSKNEMFHHKEKAKVKAIIELINLRTGRSLAKKPFTFVSNDGRKAFNSELTTLDYETLEFKSSSIGKVFWKLNNSVVDFVIQVLSSVPIEGDLISVDHKNKSAIINLGEANGITVQDVFIVFSLTNAFNDPLNQTDLGDKYTRKGVIKIIEVQGKFSRAQIMVGLDLVPGDLVVPKDRKSINHKLEDQLPERNIIWGAYKGLPSLSY